MNYTVEWTNAVLPSTGPTSVIADGGTVTIEDRRGVADVAFLDVSTTTPEPITGVVAIDSSGYHGVFAHPTNGDVEYEFGARVDGGLITGMVIRRELTAEDSGGQWGGR